MYKKQGSQSIFRSFAGGLDPTGMITTSVGKNETNRSMDNWHRAAGMLGGALGGVFLIPALAGGATSLFKTIREYGLRDNVEGGLLRQLYHSAITHHIPAAAEAAVSPFVALRNGIQVHKGLSDALSANKIHIDELSRLARRAGLLGEGENIQSYLFKNIPRVSRAMTHDFNPYRDSTPYKHEIDKYIKHKMYQKVHAFDDKVFNLNDPILKNLRTGLQKGLDTTKEKVTNITTALGLSGAIGSLASLGQYNAGKNSGIETRKLERENNRLRAQLNRPLISENQIDKQASVINDFKNLINKVGAHNVKNKQP